MVRGVSIGVSGSSSSDSGSSSSSSSISSILRFRDWDFEVDASIDWALGSVFLEFRVGPTITGTRQLFLNQIGWVLKCGWEARNGERGVDLGPALVLESGFLRDFNLDSSLLKVIRSVVATYQYRQTSRIKSPR